MNNEQKQVYEKEYLPYIIKWGKLTCWLSIPLIMIPSLVLMILYGAKVDFGQMLTALIPLCASMLAWYIVDPITLYPVLHIPGLYMTYIAGNSKEIRSPASIAAMSAADVEAGTEHGTVISCIAIAVSIFISVTVLTLVAIVGNVLLSILPPVVVNALNYLLPALYGAMCMQRVMLDPKTFFVVLPATVACVALNRLGVFKLLPLGGGYAQILILVMVGALASKKIHEKEVTQEQ